MYIGTTARGLTKEIKIPMPWGFVAAKTWGLETNTPVLCLHGWLDNANTFDTLIPLLPKDFYCVCIDLVGHGLSSHFRSGMMYNHVYSSALVYNIMQYFKWKTCSLMGHSLGGYLVMRAAYFCSEHIDKVILLDSMGIWIESCISVVKKLRRLIENQVRIETKAETSQMTKSNALNRLLRTIPDIKEVEAEILLERGLTKKKDSDSYIFNRDAKAIFGIQHLYGGVETLLYIAKNVKAEVLHLSCNKGMHYDDIPNSEFKKEMFSCFDSLKYHKLVRIDGNHFVHLSQPEKVAGHICEMLRRPPRKDLKPLKILLNQKL